MNNIKDQVNLISKLYKIFKRSKMSNNALKVARNANNIKRIMSSQFPIVKSLIPITPKSIDQGKNILHNYVRGINKNASINVNETEVQSIFKQMYIYMTKTLISLNIVGTGVAAGAAITAGWSIIIIPFTLIATISVFANSKKNNISYSQSIANFKKSFKEFLARDKFTKKEKAFAYIPYLILSILIFIIQSNWASTSITDILSKTTRIDKGRKDIAYGVDAAKEIFKSADIKISTGKNILSKTTIGEISIIFSIAFIIYLLLSLADEMILRKGEASTEV